MTTSSPVTESSRGLGPLGRRLLAAFIVVAFSSVIVLTLAALIGTALGLSANQSAERQRATSAAAAAAARAYADAGGWDGADLSRVDAIAAAAGARLLITDTAGTVIKSPEGGMMMGSAMGMGAGFGSRSKSIVVNGNVVGTVRLGFGSPATGTVQHIAWAWILVAAVVALATAIAVAWFVTRRISEPLRRLTAVAHDFAAGNRAARAGAADVVAPGELGELARAFDATADDVVRSEVARRQMAADVAHELRTPLAALQAGLEELRDGLVPADPERLTALHDQSLRLGRVVTDLAELSAAETAALSLKRDVVDLSALVCAAVDAARPTLAAAGVSITEHVDSGVATLGDSGRLHQAVGNLLANTARYCRQGDAVTVTVARLGDSAVISVADTGPGISAADQARVFDRLWRGSGNHDTSGSGIGLAVVRELIAAHDGTVRVESDGQSGSCFTVTLPAISSN